MIAVSSPYQALLERIPVVAHSVAVAGRNTAYWEYGSSTAPVTVVMVHGFRGDHHGLESVVAHLPELRVIAPDLPGFGSSAPLVGEHDIAGYARWLRNFLAALGIGDAVILGHSFGTIIVAAALADGMPAPAAILVNPIAAPALSGPRGLLTRLAVFYYWLGARLPERLGFAVLRHRAIVRLMSVTMSKTRDRALRRWIHNQHDRYFSAFANRNVVLSAFRASVGTDVSHFADRIPTPVLLIAAERDDITPLAAQHLLVARFSAGTLHVLPEVGHLIHYEAPAAAAEQIRQFLAFSTPPRTGLREKRNRTGE